MTGTNRRQRSKWIWLFPWARPASLFSSNAPPSKVWRFHHVLKRRVGRAITRWFLDWLKHFLNLYQRVILAFPPPLSVWLIMSRYSRALLHVVSECLFLRLTWSPRSFQILFRFLFHFFWVARSCLSGLRAGRKWLLTNSHRLVSGLIELNNVLAIFCSRHLQYALLNRNNRIQIVFTL